MKTLEEQIDEALGMYGDKHMDSRQKQMDVLFKHVERRMRMDIFTNNQRFAGLFLTNWERDFMKIGRFDGDYLFACAVQTEGDEENGMFSLRVYGVDLIDDEFNGDMMGAIDARSLVYVAVYSSDIFGRLNYMMSQLRESGFTEKVDMAAVRSRLERFYRSTRGGR